MLIPASRLCALRPVATSLAVTLMIACGGSGGEVTPPPSGSSSIPAPTVGTIVVALRPLGNGADADGFTTTIDGTTTRTLSASASVRYESLKPGDHMIRLAGVAPHCLAGADSAVVTVKAGVTDTLRIDMTCLGGIAFHQVMSESQYDIVYLDEQGQTIKLASGPGKRFIQGWSPDGTRLLYKKFEEGDYPSHLYSVRADGSDTRQLTSGAGTEFSARWSPDGTRIAFVQQGAATDTAGTGGPQIGLLIGSHIVVMSSDGATRRVLIDSRAFDFDPVWSADGSRLYFACSRLGRPDDLCSSAADGSGLRAIRYAAVDAVLPPCSNTVCWLTPNHFDASPDGRRILFELLPPNGPQAVWSGTLDGTSAVSLSGNVTSFGGAWSRSGARALLSLADNQGGYALATVKPDGTQYRQITNFADRDESAHLSPDEALVAFDGFESGTQQLWVMNADGSGRRRITTGPVQSFYPFFNPQARATGPLIGGEPARTSPQLTSSRSVIPQRVESDASSPASYCRPVRAGTTTRIVCPSNR